MTTILKLSDLVVYVHINIINNILQIETINCVVITRKNHIAQNGVVHLISTVLSPYSYSNRNLIQIINQV